MKKFFVLLCCALSPLTAMEEEGSPPIPNILDYSMAPSAIVHGCVSAPSGAFLMQEETIACHRYDTLSFTHSYNSRNETVYPLGTGISDNHYSWVSHYNVSYKESQMVVHDTQGSTIQFSASCGTRKKRKHRRFHVDPVMKTLGLTNYSGGDPSGRTNPFNYTINPHFSEFTLSDDHKKGNWQKKGFTLENGSGERMKYTHTPHRLDQVIRPNGNRLKYEYVTMIDDFHRRLYSYHDKKRTNISLLGKKKEKLSELSIDSDAMEHVLRGKSSSRTFSISSDNNRSVTYKIKREGPHHWLLRSFYCNPKKQCTFQYTGSTKKTRWGSDYFFPLLSEVHRGDGRSLFIDYDDEQRVETLRAPFGENDEIIPIYRFIYPKERRGVTEVQDAQGYKTLYHRDGYDRLIAKETLDPQGELYQRVRFRWSKKYPKHQKRKSEEEKKEEEALEGLLQQVNVEDGTQKSYSSVYYEYDDRGNVVSQACYGEFSGESPDRRAWVTDHTYSKNNLRTSTTDSDGFTTLYTYEPKRDLLIRKQFSYKEIPAKHEELFSYTQSGQLEQKTIHTLDDTFYWSSDYKYTNGLKTREIEYSKDHSNRLVQLKISDYLYDEADRVVQENHYDANDNLHYSIQYEYDCNDNITKQTDPIGRTFLYDYDMQNNKIYEELVDSGYRTYYTYDLANRLIKKEQQHDDGRTFTQRYIYDSKGNKTQNIDVFGNTTTYQNDFLGRLEKVTLPEIESAEGLCSPTETYTYTIDNQIQSFQKGEGFITEHNYNARNQVLDTVHPDGTVEEKRYNLNGTLKTEKKRDGTVYHYFYDRYKHPTRVKTFDSEGNLLKETRQKYNEFFVRESIDPLGYTTSYIYDRAGRKEKEVRQTEQGKSTTTYEYDSAGRLTTTKLWHEEDAFIATIQELDSLDRVTEERIEDSFGAVQQKTTYQYDIQGNLIQEVRYQDESTPSITTWDYDSKGDLISATDPLGNTTHYEHNYFYQNNLGQYVLQTTTTDPLGNLSIETHNAVGDIASFERRNSLGETLSLQETFYNAARENIREVHHNIEQKTTYTIDRTYNPMGELLSQTEQKQKTTSYTYTAQGQLATITKPSGIVLCHTYDALGRLATLISSDNTVAYSYTYDINNNLIQITDEINHTTHKRTYNSFGELIEETLPNNLSTSYQYDPIGRIIQFTLPDSSHIAYQYNAVDLLSVSRTDSESNPLYTHTYNKTDLLGNPLQSTLIDNSSLEFTYDSLERIRSISHPLFSQSIPEEGYDAAGNLLSLRTQQEEATFSYNDRYQLIEEAGLFSHTYTCDSLDNRLQKDDTPYTLNEFNQILSTEKETFHYDPDGNLIQKGDTLYTYDALNRLTTIETPITKLTYTYDSFGRRTSKSTPDETFTYLYQLSREIGVYQNQTPLALRCLGHGKRGEIGAAIAIELEGTPYAPLHDYRGSVTTLIDLQTKQPLETYQYSAFGELQEQPISSNPWLFLSQHYEPETGLLYFGQRYYDASLGRWLTTDPAGYEDGPNLYAYVHHSPLIYYDLDGLWSQEFNYKDTLPDFRLDPIYDNNNWIDIESQVLLPQGPSRPVTLNGHYNFEPGKDCAFLEPSNTGIGYINGIWNTYFDALNTMLYISKLSGGYDINGLYNATHHRKIRECVLGLRGHLTNPAMELQKQWDNFFDKHGQDAYYLQICHSQGAIHTRNALRFYPEELRKRIIVVAIAPAAYIDEELCGKVDHYCCTRDLVPRIDRQGRRRCRNTIHYLRPHKDAKGIFDHSIQSPTYRKVIEKHIAKHIEMYGGIN